MDISIYINCDNASFCDIPEIEVSRILSELAEDIEYCGVKERKLMDFNGNEVGYLEISNKF